MKVKEIIELAQNDEELFQERQKAVRNRDKYVGINSDGRSATSVSSSSTMSSNTPTAAMSSSKSCSFDDAFRSRRAQESIADEKKWQDQQNTIQNDLYGRINEFTSKIKNILEHRKEDESSEDEQSGGNKSKPNGETEASNNHEEVFEDANNKNHDKDLNVENLFFF